jgi:hypothetical protein
LEHGKSRVKDFAMQVARPSFAIHPRLFGRGPVRVLAEPSSDESTISADLKLFAATFAAGFLFVSILIG